MNLNDINDGILAVWFCDTEEERDERRDIFDDNPDFTYLGHFDMTQDIYFELNECGFSDDEIEAMTHAQYGRCLEIIEYASHYDAYIGQR